MNRLFKLVTITKERLASYPAHFLWLFLLLAVKDLMREVLAVNPKAATPVKQWGWLTWLLCD